MHPLLQRQVKRHWGDKPRPPEVESLLRAVSDAYVAADDDRALLEHSLELSSRELSERYAALQRDIAEREKAENERDAFFRLSIDLLCIVDLEFRLLQANDGWCRTLGYSQEELRPMRFNELVHVDDLERALATARQTLARGETAGFEVRLRTKAGGYRWFSWSASVDSKTERIYAAGRDITAQRQIESELRQAQKLEAVGQLASGVAHEINTPIQFIGDNLSFVATSWSDIGALIAECEVLAKREEPFLAGLKSACEHAELDYLKGEVPSSIDEAKDGVRRVAELVRALKEFAHPDRPQMVFADVNQALTRTLVLARSEVKYVADIETSLGDIPSVECHVGALNQVFLNLLVNAAHAIEDKNKKLGVERRGVIRVSTKRDGDHVVIAIGDSGCGIPVETQPRIWEPFFTTKEVGRGSGQGLPLARAIVVEKHGGTLEFETEVGVGTTFFARLPIKSSQGAEDERAAA